jgi:hypothetical protein
VAVARPDPEEILPTAFSLKRDMLLAFLSSEIVGMRPANVSAPALIKPSGAAQAESLAYRPVLPGEWRRYPFSTSLSTATRALRWMRAKEGSLAD